jgi:hypothetical protein
LCIYLFFYLFSVDCAVLPTDQDDGFDIQILDGFWLPSTLNCTEAQQCENNTLMTRTTFQLVTNDSYVEDQLEYNTSYVETLLISTENCTDENAFINAVFLSVETMGYFAIDFEYMEENFTQPEPSENPEPESMINPEPEDNMMPFPLNPQPSPNTMPQPNSNMMPCPISSSNPVPYSDLDMVNETTNSSYWFPIVFTPTNFRVTILSNESDIFFSYSNDTCMPIMDYWEDDIMGCPCDGAWNTTGYYDQTTNSFMGGRNITPSLCPPNTCQEMFFLNDTQKYANLRLNISIIDNGTVLRTLEITKMSICKEMGYAYGDGDILYSFKWGQGRPMQMNLNDQNDVPKDNDGHDDDDDDSGYHHDGSALLPLSMIITITTAFLMHVW